MRSAGTSGGPSKKKKHPLPARSNAASSLEESRQRCKVSTFGSSGPRTDSGLCRGLKSLHFHPNDLPSLADGHKKLTFGVTKVVLVSTLLFKDYMVIFTHFCQTCYKVYTHHIDNFSGSHSMYNTMKNKFGKFLQELFSRGVCVARPQWVMQRKFTGAELNSHWI